MMGIIFLTHLQSEGCMTISDVSEASVLSFFYSGGEIVREATYKGHILAVLKINQNRDEIFRRLISFLMIRRIFFNNLLFLPKYLK